MKRYLAIFGILFIGVIAGLIVRGIPIVLQVNAGGGIQADRNGDVNGDARLDMSDAIYLLLHIFRGGPQPVALAQAEPADLGGLEGSLGSIAASLQDIAKESRRESAHRFIDNGDETLTDQYLSGRMWKTRARGGVGLIVQGHAGYNDWRRPTAMEMMSLLRKPTMSGPREISILPAFTGISFADTYFGTEEGVKILMSSDDSGRGYGIVRLDTQDLRTGYLLLIRDTGPNE